TGVGGLPFYEPTSSITYSNGTRVAETDYAYDQTAVSSVSTVQHDDTNYPANFNVRGNLTTKTVPCFAGTTNCSTASSITRYTYDQTGQLLSAVDPCGNAACNDMTGG